MGSEQRNALFAVVLSGAILFGWQYYFSPKQVAAPVGPTVTKTESNAPATPGSIGPNTTAPVDAQPVVQNEEFTISGAATALTFDNSLTIKKIAHTNANEASVNFTDMVGSAQPMKVEFDFGNGFQTLRFAKTETENKFFNAATETTVVTTLSDKGVVQFNATSPKPFKYRFIFKAEEKKLENGQERVFAFFTDKLNRYKPTEDEAGDRAIKWAGIDFNYHLFATYFEKAPALIYKNGTDKSFTMFSNKAENALQYSVVYVKKEYNYLTSLGHNLNGSVDFGIWGFFAVWILKGLQFFHTYFPNYGVSIILLTLLIRLITFPLQYKSFVSMKKLQLVQPELTKIREKFKDDPQRMQKESMELFKKSGANPIGGCLPLLLQMPVFFAFYKVLHAAVELVDAPFILWIQDLSNKDPYYVLPVLMTGAMFLQQKMTPNTITDPVQKKVMMFMPLIFGVIMKDLPSGLSLYIFVSTLFGIIQQTMVFNAKAKNTPVVV
jgi:YidC/Oxa1 family membrane protein insertase